MSAGISSAWIFPPFSYLRIGSAWLLALGIPRLPCTKTSLSWSCSFCSLSVMPPIETWSATLVRVSVGHVGGIRVFSDLFCFLITCEALQSHRRSWDQHHFLRLCFFIRWVWAPWTIGVQSYGSSQKLEGVIGLIIFRNHDGLLAYVGIYRQMSIDENMSTTAILYTIVYRTLLSSMAFKEH